MKYEQDKQPMQDPFYTIRKANPEEAAHIRRLIYRVQINPLGLDWRRFQVAVDTAGLLLGCGQVKPHSDGIRELASIAVLPPYQGRGIAGAIIRRLIAENPGRLYLTCRASMGPFYERFGFQSLEAAHLPPYFRRIRRLAVWLRRLSLMGDLLIMEREGVV